MENLEQVEELQKHIAQKSFLINLRHKIIKEVNGNLVFIDKEECKKEKSIKSARNKDLITIHSFLCKIAVDDIVKIKVTDICNKTNISRMKVCDRIIDLKNKNIIKKIGRNTYKLLVLYSNSNDIKEKSYKILDIDRLDDDFFFREKEDVI